MTTKVVVKLNTKPLTAALKDAVKDVATDLEQQFKISLNSPLFAWGSTTYRRNGEVVGDPRNAIDTGDLLDSSVIVPVSDYQFDIVWQVDYAEKIFQHSTVDLLEFTATRVRG